MLLILVHIMIFRNAGVAMILGPKGQIKVTGLVSRLLWVF